VQKICGDQLSPLIMRVRVLHAAGTSGLEGFGEKKFSSWVEIFFFYKKMGPQSSPPFHRTSGSGK